MGQMNAITGYITQLLTQHVGQFASLGQTMFLSLATIMIVWFGLKSALSAGEHGSGFHFGQFAGLVIMIAFGYAMTQYYATPIPGIGRHQPVSEPNSVSRNHRHRWQYRLHPRPDHHGSMAGGRHHHHRLRLCGSGYLRSRRSDLCSVFHRPQARMALLGMAEMLHAVRLLTGHCGRNDVRHGQPCDLRADPAAISPGS
jgi:hypothetical protein